MRKKLILLATLYYISLIVSSCCNGRLFFEVSFKKTEVSRLNNTYFPTFIISGVDPVEESGFLNGAIAKFQGFKSALATPKCPEDVYSYKHVITSIKITSNNDFDTLFTAGSLLNDLFKINLSKKINLDEDEDEEVQYYYLKEYNAIYNNTLAEIELKTQSDSLNMHDLYFKYEFDNGEIHLDTLFNQTLNSDSLYFNY